MRTEKELSVPIGTKTYLLTSDDEYLDQVSHGFEPHMVKLFTTLVREGDRVADVGANIGCTSILFGEISRAVLAFEPSPTTFRYLAMNIRRSGLENIQLHNCALGSERGESELTFSQSNRAGGFVSDQTKASPDHVTERIVIERLDDILTRLKVAKLDFLKIDTEGFEMSVLRGAQSTLERFRPVVVMELNHWCLNAFRRICVPDFFDFLRATFPVLWAVDGDTYADIHEEGERYKVMYHHIIHFRYPNIVAAFDRDRLTRFCEMYRHEVLP